MKISSIKFFSCLRFSILFAVSVTILLYLAGCASHRQYKSQPELTGYSQTGIASFYAMKFQNRKTASGERFNNYSMTAAHKSLPFGTKVKVTNLNNGKTVMVRINDRGPFVRGRIIDLSRAAFAKIERIDKGITPVKIRVVN
jgi:rare lipoprotein A